MPEIRCTNYAGFDEVTQSYRLCNQKIRVPDERLGSNITCPKCNQSLTVADPGNEQQALDPIESPQIQPGADVMSMDFDSKMASKGVFNTARKRCPKCGGYFDDDGVCQTCNYVEPIQDAQRRNAQQQPLRPAGFQLWLQAIATEGVSLTIIGYVVFATCCLFGLLMLAIGILSQSILGAFVAALAAFFLFFVFAVFLKTRQLATVRNADLGILKPAWNLILLLARWQNWQNYDSNLKGRNIIDLRTRPVDDAGLAQVGGLKNCQVLDLENSNITDNGLKCLYGLSYLQCVVLKNNEVSDDAVTMLQQKYPRLWIWK